MRRRRHGEYQRRTNSCSGTSEGYTGRNRYNKPANTNCEPGARQGQSRRQAGHFDRVGSRTQSYRAVTIRRAVDPYKEIHRAARVSAFAAMQREMRDLRGMLEQQIAGVAWGNMAKFQPKQAKLLQRLMRIDLNPGLCEKIVDEMAMYPQADYSWRQALGLLARKIPVTNDDILSQGGVVALVGPTGVGKTTTVAKLAARFGVRHGTRSVALITTDNFRIGAHEQLRAYTKILDVPLRVVSSRADLRQALNDFSDRKLVLIDTAGMSQRDLRLSEQFSLIKGGSSLIKTYLVLSATTRVEGLSEITHAFGRIKLSGSIVTKVDEIDVLGNILNVLIKYQLPIAYVSDGQRVPEDLHVARGHSLVSRSLAGLKQRSWGKHAASVSQAVAFN